jgi:hypothetical protein
MSAWLNEQLSSVNRGAFELVEHALEHIEVALRQGGLVRVGGVAPVAGQVVERHGAL